MSIIFNIIESKSTVNVVNDFVRITVADGVSVDTVDSLIDDKLTKENIDGIKESDSPQFIDTTIPALNSVTNGGEVPDVDYNWVKGLYASLVDGSVKSFIKGLLSVVKSRTYGNQGTITETILGDVRGNNATDFQFNRSFTHEVAASVGSFIAGGARNKIANIVERGSNSFYGHAEGFKNSVHEWYGHAEGSGCINDGKIAHVEGNGSICSANDSHVEGNRTIGGRKYYSGITFGSEDANDELGILQYVVIPDVEGDVRGYFPNALFDSAYILSTYGSGAQKDTVGNIYASGFTPAIWSGDTLITANSLPWALHRICIVRGSSENDISFVTIAKAIYNEGSGTKIYYYGAKPYTTLIGIYSSYAPTVSINGIQLGNGLHAEGLFASAIGYGSHAEGNLTRAWNYAAHAEGNQTKAVGNSSHSEGLLTEANGLASHAQNRETVATGDYSSSLGLESIALRNHQIAYSTGKRTAKGDDQIIRINYSLNLNGVGWFELYILRDLEDGKTYHFDTMVLGIQYGGTVGIVGDSFAYRFKGLFQRSGEIYTIIGTPIRELIARSSTLSGDGLTTGIRVTFYGRYPAQNRVVLRYDGLANTIYRVQCSSLIQELKFT